MLLRYAPRRFRVASVVPRLFLSSKILKPDPNKVPRSEPIDVLANAPKKTNTIEDFNIADQVTPANNIESVTSNGFVLTSGARIESKPGALKGLILLGREAFVVNMDDDSVKGIQSGRVELDKDKLLAIFDVVHPKPELLVLGLGGKSRILGQATKNYFVSRGMQTEIGTTLNSASNFDLLASERGSVVAALLLPPNI